jgi:hypothetical protein
MEAIPKPTMMKIKRRAFLYDNSSPERERYSFHSRERVHGVLSEKVRLRETYLHGIGSHGAKLKDEFVFRPSIDKHAGRFRGIAFDRHPW